MVKFVDITDKKIKAREEVKRLEEMVREFFPKRAYCLNSNSDVVYVCKRITGEPIANIFSGNLGRISIWTFYSRNKEDLGRIKFLAEKCKKEFGKEVTIETDYSKSRRF